MASPSRTWAAWLAATLTSFAVLEARALRLWLGIHPAAKRRWVAAGLFAAFWAWLVGHVCFGWAPNDLPRRRAR